MPVTGDRLEHRREDADDVNAHQKLSSQSTRNTPASRSTPWTTVGVYGINRSRSPCNHQHVVRAGLEQVVHNAQLLSGEINNLQSFQLRPVIFARFQLWQPAHGYFDIGAHQRRGLIAIGTTFEPRHDAPTVGPAFRQLEFAHALRRSQTPGAVLQNRFRRAGIGMNLDPTAYAEQSGDASQGHRTRCRRPLASGSGGTGVSARAHVAARPYAAGLCVFSRYATRSVGFAPLDIQYATRAKSTRTFSSFAVASGL